PVAVLLELQRSDVAAFVKLHVHDIVAYVLDAAILADLGQETRQLRRIDVVGILLWTAIAWVTQTARSKIVFERLARERDSAHEILIGDIFAIGYPVFLEWVAWMDAVQSLPAGEWVKKADQLSVGVRVPAVEPDAKFERRINAAHEFRL